MQQTTFAITIDIILLTQIIIAMFALDQKVNEMDLPHYMASLIERNEKDQIEVEKSKVSIAILKQMNNYSRIALDAAKYEMKKQEFDIKHPIEQ